MARFRSKTRHGGTLERRFERLESVEESVAAPDATTEEIKDFAVRGCGSVDIHLEYDSNFRDF